MTAHDCDVLVAGAGLPGLALAVALGQRELRVALADRAPVMAEVPRDDACDARVYAVSPGSVAFLTGIGAWQLIPPERIAAIETMRVEGDRGAVLTFSAYDLGERALAWIVEESALRSALVDRLHASPVKTFAPVSFDHLAFTPDAGTLTLADGTQIQARLVAGADGVRSWVRRAAGIVAEPRPYGQTAVVANFACTRPHRGCARQWFLADGGVLAWLPLPGRRMSIVWCASPSLADELMVLDPATLAARVAAAGAHALGELELITPPAAYPLHFLRLPVGVAHRLALVGDAAHGIHPLAGQGVNLGFGDAQVLVRVLAERAPLTDPGTPILLERFARRRAEPVLAVQAVTDGLARLFGARSSLLAQIRNVGLAAVDRLPYIKRALAQPVLR